MRIIAARFHCFVSGCSAICYFKLFITLTYTADGRGREGERDTDTRGETEGEVKAGVVTFDTRRTVCKKKNLPANKFTDSRKTKTTTWTIHNE